MREHEVPTHVQAEDRVLLGFTFPQIVAVTAVCAISYGAYRYAPVGPSEARMALAVLFGLVGIAMVVGKIGGRRLPLVAADLLKYRLGARRYAGPVSQLVRAEPPTPTQPVRSGPGAFRHQAQRAGRGLARLHKKGKTRKNKERRNGRMRWFGKRRGKDAGNGRGQGHKAETLQSRRRKPRMGWIPVVALAVLMAAVVAVPASALADDHEPWRDEIDFDLTEPVEGRRIFVEGLTVSGDRAAVTLRAATALDIRVRAFGGPQGAWLRFWGSATLAEGERIDYSLPLHGPAPSFTVSWEDALGQAGALNALDFPAQLLIRQHAPRLEGMREKLKQAQPEDLPPQTRAAAESLRRLLTDLEARDGILDRRFYAVCESGRIDDLRGLLARAGLSVHLLKGRQLRMFLVAATLGGSPSEFDEETPVEVEIGRRDVRVGDRLVRSLHLGKWPRSLAPGFLQGLMAAGAPMDLSVHVGPIPAEQAARTLEWQKVRFESAQSLSFKRGRTMSPEAEIALEDITRLRDEVQRGRERLFHASLSVTLHAKDEASLKEMTQRAKAHFGATLGKLDNLAFRQREGLLSTLPLALNAVAEWRSLDTSSIARLFPFSPPDLDTRSGTLYGIDMRACSPVVYDPWDGTHLNANTAVLARSGSGKSFATKLGVLRGLTRGITAYVIDPEGEYADMARAAGGRVLSPGVPGEGMNPFVIERGDSEEMLQRIGSLRRLIEVMVGESLGAERRASLDHALAGYYAKPRERTGFRDFYKYLQEDEAGNRDPESSSGQALARLLRPFATGSLRHLLSDEGDDLLGNEALVTVFDLRLLEPELRPAAAMVCTETVWAAAAQDPKPRLLVVDEVWSIMQHPEGAAFMVSMAKRARKHRLGLQFITQDVQDLLSEDTSRTITGHSGRALLQNAAFKLLLQQDAAAIRTVGDAFDLPEDLQRWLLSCPRGDGLLLARGNRFPVRIEATPEETAVIEWRPGQHGQRPLPPPVESTTTNA